MRPILFDSATISLQGKTKKFSIGYRTTTDLFGKEKSVLDIVDMSTSEIFSLFVDVIFCIKIVGDDPRVIARLGSKLIAYENYGKSEIELEPDGDKKEVTPLGYYNYYVARKGSHYVPYSLGVSLSEDAIEEFKDYYGFGAYRDTETGVEHFVLLIEDITSTSHHPDWYFTNNFIPDSETLDFPGDAEIDSWQIE